MNDDDLQTQDEYFGRTDSEKAKKNPIREEYERSGFSGTYTEWLEKIAGELIPDCMKPWKEGF